MNKLLLYIKIILENNNYLKNIALLLKNKYNIVALIARKSMLCIKV